MNKSTFLRASLVFMMLLLTSCIPAHLQKYRQPQNTSSSSSSAPTESVDDNFVASGSDPTLTRSPNQDSQKPSSGGTPAIYPIDAQTYRFQVKDSDVWDAALSVLLKNYNLTIVDKNAGIITTEWDSFYLKKAIFRNKLSMRVRRISWNAVDVTIHNSIERLQDGASAGTVGAVWLPSEDVANESARIIQNMAIALNRPAPVMPTGIMATGGSEKGTDQSSKPSF